MKFIEGLESYFEQHQIAKYAKVIGDEYEIYAMWKDDDVIRGVCLGTCCRETDTNHYVWPINSDSREVVFFRHNNLNTPRVVKNKRRVV